jgi:hypothetical protein
MSYSLLLQDTLTTVQFGPCEEDEVVCGSERFTAAGTPCPRELGTLGVVEVIKRGGINQAIVLAVGRKCRKRRSGRFIRGPALQPLGVPVEIRWCIGTVRQKYLVLNYLIIKVTLFF